MESRFLESLNEEQKEAVLTNSGSLLVFAGAGSGKTRVITTKIAYAIEQNIVKPYQILAVTFTNKACREMKERVEAMVGPELASQTVIRTFHSFGVWLLRRYADKAGLDKDFTIYDDKQSAALLKQCFPNAEAAEITSIANDIALCKERNLPIEGKYLVYQQQLSRTGNADFGDLIIKPIELLKNNPEVKEAVQNRFRYILVDEYQDTNPSQLELLKQIVGPDTFICVVGDDDQSIYRFRSADVKTILSFPKIFPQTKTVVLGKNYRCSENILTVAKELIDHNKARQPKQLESANGREKNPRLYYFPTYLYEAKEVARLIQTETTYPYKSTAILYRTNAQSAPFEDALRFRNIPYKVVGDVSFFSREEVVDSVSLLRFVINPNDYVAFERIVSKTVAGVGAQTIRRIVDNSKQSFMDVVEISKQMLDCGELKGVAGTAMKQFIENCHAAEIAIGTMPNSDFMKKLVNTFGLVELYTKRDLKEKLKDNNRVENINQLVAKFTYEAYCENLEGLLTFIEDFSLEPLEDDAEKKDNAVTLISMHRTKGLEFDRVFVTGLEDKIFKGSSYLESKEDEEEERRLCYVAFTRARHDLVISCSAQRFMYGRTYYDYPVKFLDEINTKHLTVTDLRYSRTESYSSCGYQPSYRSSYEPSYDNQKYQYGKPLRVSRDSYDDWEPVKKPAVLIKKKTDTVKKNTSFKFEVGERVRHEMLGPGTITALKKFGTKDIVTVTFDDGKMGTYLKDKFDFEKID